MSDLSEACCHLCGDRVVGVLSREHCQIVYARLGEGDLEEKWEICLECIDRINEARARQEAAWRKPKAET